MSQLINLKEKIRGIELRILNYKRECGDDISRLINSHHVIDMINDFESKYHVDGYMWVFDINNNTLCLEEE